ncbi:hypothetical protein AYO44_08860 [Planctomycetaceae bacterium SCGC AG-212-F19]|nr:hypothetical protein AYO44_08860 [Planctomycetaceae bacterium SCGC AG-212-F19]
MRVALLSASAPSGDAIGQQLADKAAFFAARAADLRLFILSGRRLHPALESVSHILPDAHPRGDAWNFTRSADLVIADCSQYYPLLDWLPLLADHRRRILFDYHGVTPPELWGSHNRESLEQGVRQRGLVWFADAAITHSRFARRELVHATHFPAERLFDLGYVIDRAAFQPEAAGSLRSRLGLELATLLLFVGRVAPNKRLPVLVDALAELRDASPPVHAIVIGDTSDAYHAEAARCRQRATEIGVADRLHWLGQVDAALLRDAYHSADVFVMPSIHEGFSLPVREAQACGLPVIAARATALPEAVGSAGLTFTPDDSADLARQIRRVLTPPRKTPETIRDVLRVAVVACRYGNDIVGGAETSLRTIAATLHSAGHLVEVFATCAVGENDAGDCGAEDCAVVDGITVRRFPTDRRDPARFAAAQERMATIGAAAESEYLAHSVRSAGLLTALREQIDEFDAVIVGPYLHGLTHDIVRAFPDKVLVLPCFHDEPAARLPGLLAAYRDAGSILYHSPEEQAFAEIELGVNHPRAACVGTWMETTEAGNPEQGRQLVGTGRRYLLYAGRFAPQKNVPLLCEWARRYASAHPERFTFTFIGEGQNPAPGEDWAVTCGRVDAASSRDLLAGASALVQLSTMESLSLVVLEAWTQGVPVIVHRDCAVLSGQLARSQGGQAVGDYPSFALALDDLWANSLHWQALGQHGQAYVRRAYGDRETYRHGLEDAVRGLHEPLREAMRRRGFLQAARYDKAAWQEQFGRIVDHVLHAPPRQSRADVQVRPRIERRSVPAGLTSTAVPLTVANIGTNPIAADGLARWVIRSEVRTTLGDRIGSSAGDTPLPGLLAPGQAALAVARVGVPDEPGDYEAFFWVEPAMQQDRSATSPGIHPLAESSMHITVLAPSAAPAPAPILASFMPAAQNALAQAEKLQQLPDDYLDITQGWLARWKRFIKSKLLNNFRRAYVDVLSRQQSAFNHQMLRAVQELAESCAALAQTNPTQMEVPNQMFTNDGHADGLPAGAVPAREQELLDELAENRRQLAALERRLARLEALLLAREMVIT